MTATKCCPTCGEEKSLEEFPRDKNRSDGRHCYCKQCDRERNRVWRTNNPGKRKNSRLKQDYGIDIQMFNTLHKEQAGVCKICCEPCSTGLSLAVDHNHDTGRVRGLLCMKCNRGIGYLNDNPDLLRRAIAYLEAYQ